MAELSIQSAEWTASYKQQLRAEPQLDAKDFVYLLAA